MRLVFVSSTFKDMQFERDELNSHLAPRINDFLIKYGESVRFGDLRWGVNTSELESEESSKKVLRVCLDEIDNSKPYMIVFIGERYGWIPSGDLLDQAMKMKNIKDIPNDISVTNLEIEYGALLNPDYEGRILFYFRKPFDTSKMSEEERKIYESESPLHKEKLEALKKKILELYPEYVRYYDVKYDENDKRLTGLDNLMDMVYADLTRIFDIDFSYLNSLPRYQRAIANSEVYFESFYKYAYFRENLADEVDPNSELKDNYNDGRYEDIPCLRYVSGAPGSGRKTTIACLYKLAKEENKDYVLPFVFGLDEFTKDKQALIETLISFYEEKLGYKNFKSKNVYTLADLIKYNDTHDKHHFQIFIMNHDQEIVLFLKELELLVKEMYHTTFYAMGNSENKYFSPYLAFGFHSNQIVLEDLTDEEKIGIINKICESKRKELSPIVINEILGKEGSGSPLYISLVVERLLMLDSDDFQNIRNLGDGMTAINEYMLSTVRNIGNDVFSISKELFKELAERINSEVVMRILYLTSHDCILDPEDYADFFEKNDINYRELDFSLLYNLMPILFTPIKISGALSFAFEDAKKAAKELSEEHVEKDFYKCYINYLNEKNNLSFIKKLIVYRKQKDTESFYTTYVDFIKAIKIQSLSDLVSSKTVSNLDIITKILKEEKDGFVDDFIMCAINVLLDKNDENRDVVLSTIFYPYIFGDSSDEDRLNFSMLLLRITERINEKFKAKTPQNLKNLNLLGGLVNYLNYAVTNGEYSFNMDDEDSHRYDEASYKLATTFNRDEYLEELKNSSIYYIYYIMFNRRAMLDRSVFNFNYEDEYSKHDGYYKNDVVNNLHLDDLNNALINEDFSLWSSKCLVDSVISLFYNLLITKYESNEEDYYYKLNHFLKVAEIALQHDFFSLNRCSAYESYFIEPLFKAFSMLLNEDGVDEITKYNLSDWLLIRSRENCTKYINDIGYISIYANMLKDREDDIPDKDFFFIYPLLYKVLQNHFDNELWMTTMSLLINNHTLYDFEIDLEFLYLADFHYQSNQDLSAIFVQLVTLFEVRNRSFYEDELITNLYKYLYNDLDAEDEDAFNEYLEEYAKWIPADEDRLQEE